MKLSVRIDAAEESGDGGSTDFLPPKISEVLEEYLREIFPDSEKFESSEVSLTFVKPDEIRELNREYRGIDEATDVLSFPMIDDVPEDLPVLMLGDIVICPEKTFELHPDLSHREAIGLMIAHSFLHLLGYDHETEEEQSRMWAKQNEILEALERC